MRRASRPFLVALALSCAAACAGPERPWEGPKTAVAPESRPYSGISPAGRAELRRAVGELELGRVRAAEARLERVRAEAPTDLIVAIWWQEVRLAAEEQRALDAGRSLEGASAPRARLRREARRSAEARPGAAAYFLAARLEDDPRSARLLLERALEIDPRMAWAHYGLAHVAAREGDWSGVRAGLEQTFELQPGHLPALRLFAWSQAVGGDIELAIDAYEAWLEAADEDLLATRATRDAARVDLALALASSGRPERALEWLDELEDPTREPGRVNSARAAALEATGDASGARRAAAEARRLAPRELLPAVQEALLLELWFDDAPGAREAWREVLELSGGSADLAAGLQRFRAQVHLQRLAKNGLGGRP